MGNLGRNMQGDGFLCSWVNFNAYRLTRTDQGLQFSMFAVSNRKGLLMTESKFHGVIPPVVIPLTAERTLDLEALRRRSTAHD